MRLSSQKRLAADVLRASSKRVKFSQARLGEIKEAITKLDIKNLINDGAIILNPKKGVSRGRARKHQEQRRKGRRKGPGSKKGTTNARIAQKRVWINKVRLQRSFLSELKKSDLLKENLYKQIRAKVKSGFFRNKKHLKFYLNDHDLFKKK